MFSKIIEKLSENCNACRGSYIGYPVDEYDEFCSIGLGMQCENGNFCLFSLAPKFLIDILTKREEERELKNFEDYYASLIEEYGSIRNNTSKEA